MESRLLALEAQVRQVRPVTGSSAPVVAPFWDIVLLDDSVAVTPDAFAEFDDETRTDRVFSSQATARGELFLHQWTNHCPMRARIAFDASAPFTVNVRVLADGAGNWYLILNGDQEAHTGPADLTLSCRAGRNVLMIVKDDANTDRFLLHAVLFGTDLSTWAPF